MEKILEPRKKPIFPDIEIEGSQEDGKTKYTFYTWIRKESERKYYLIHVKKEYILNTESLLSFIIKQFCIEVYLTQNLYIINDDILKTYNIRGFPLVELDTNQTNEIERLKDKYIPKPKNINNGNNRETTN